MIIKAFGNDHITTYKFMLSNKKIMFDFDGNIGEDDVTDLDYIFLSHEHFDHIGKLFDYRLIKAINSNCVIYSTLTTKLLIENIASDYLSSEHFNKESANIILNKIKSIEPLFFNKKVKIGDDLFVTLLRSGHTFGSSMIYLEGEKSILYTGDIDYVASDQNRQYRFSTDNYHIQVDYLIADGTCLSKDSFKGIKDHSVVDFLKRKKPGSMISYNVRPEKAIFYFTHLAKKLDNILFIYPSTMVNYLTILTNQGYYPFFDDKVVYLHDEMQVNGNDKYDNCAFVTIDKSSKYSLDLKLSLHISRHELKNLILNHITNEPKILFGHYDLSDNDINDNLNDFPNSYLLTKGDHNYE